MVTNDKSLRQTVGEKIRKLREARVPRLSRERLAEMLGINQISIYKWEKGVFLPNAENLEALARIFKVSVHELTSVEIVPTAKLPLEYVEAIRSATQEAFKQAQAEMSGVALEIIKQGQKEFSKVATEVIAKQQTYGFSEGKKRVYMELIEALRKVDELYLNTTLYGVMDHLKGLEKKHSQKKRL